MRHIDLRSLLDEIFADTESQRVKQSLERAHQQALKRADAALRLKYIQVNGGGKWSPIKDRLIALLGMKCWYTEVELTGAPLAIDHYRPICHYWWLAFDPDNYRVACPWANSLKHNAKHGCAGGKGDNFPLLPPAAPRATLKNQLPNERPVILDPCSAEDCELLAFQADGRPILNPNFATDAVAAQRVENSKLLLNLDHPDFNSKREQLCNDIANDVLNHEDLPTASAQRAVIRAKLAARLAVTAPFSTAARFYLQLHREHEWVENILNPS